MPGRWSRGGGDDLTAVLADCDSSQALYARLSTFLARLQALPAILYVRSGESLHPVAGFDCSHEVPNLPVFALPDPERSSELPANQLPLTLRGEVVGLLAIFGHVSVISEPLHRCCAILALKIRQLHQEEALRRELHLANEQLAHLISAGQLLQHLEIDVLLNKILAILLGALRVDCGAVVVRDRAHPEVAQQATWGLRTATVSSLTLRSGVSVIDHLLATGTILHLGKDQLRDDLLEHALPQLGGLLALPLSARGRVQGVVLLGAKHDFNPAQRRLAETLSSFAAVALDNALMVGAMVDSERIAQELAIARSVQEGMYPTHGLAVDRLRIEGSSRPCNETGGDYFTYLAQGGRVTLLIGDVSGHGLGAALFATMAHAIVQHRLHAGTPTSTTSIDLNQGLCHAQNGRFMTCAMVSLDQASLTFTYVSAGHCPLLWLHQGQVRWLESGGLPLGIILDNALALAGPFTMAGGDYLLLYTDGVTEAANAAGESFGDQRLAAAVIQAAGLHLGPTELMMLVNAEVDAWSGGRAHSDDLTMVALHVAP